MKSIIAIIFLCLSLKATALELLPSSFSDNLIYLTPELENGQTITFFTDTGGGYNAISEELVQKYKWDTSTLRDSDGEYLMVDMPKYSIKKGIPVGGLNNFMQGKLFVVPKSEIDNESLYDGFLGARWHAEKKVYINYSKEIMAILSNFENIDFSNYEIIKIGFSKDEHSNYTTALPSLSITISNQNIPTLLDTGATAYLSDNAKKLLKTSSNKVATSFLAASIFDKLKEQNPEWRFINNGDTLAKEDMLEVQEIKIGTLSIGPVWFTRREDTNFTQYMSAMMDTTVYGAIGGSALKNLDIVIDYPEEHLLIRYNSDVTDNN